MRLLKQYQTVHRGKKSESPDDEVRRKIIHFSPALLLNLYERLEAINPKHTFTHFPRRCDSVAALELSVEARGGGWQHNDPSPPSPPLPPSQYY